MTDLVERQLTGGVQIENSEGRLSAPVSWNWSTFMQKLNNTDDDTEAKERNTWPDSRGWLVISERAGMKLPTSQSLLLLQTCKMYQSNDVIHRQAPPLTTDHCDIKHVICKWIDFIFCLLQTLLWQSDSSGNSDRRRDDKWHKQNLGLFLEQLCNTMNYSKCRY